MDIKKKFTICNTCKGDGSTWVHSHDCWGSDDSYKVCCYTCRGFGFTIKQTFVNEIKKSIRH